MTYCLTSPFFNTNINHRRGNNKNEVIYLKKHVFLKRLVIFIISVAMIFSLTSCSQQKKPIPKKPDKSQSGEQNKPPKELDKLSKAVEKIEKTLSEMHERSKKPLMIQQSEVQKQMGKEKKQPQQQQGQQQGQGSQSGGGQGQGQGGGGGQSGGGGGSSGGGQQQGQQPSQIQLVTPEEKLMEPQVQEQQARLQVQQANMQQFEKLKKDVVALHSTWNAFEAKAKNQYLMQDSITNFETGLNDLTKSVESSDVYQSLLDVTQLLKYMPDFYMAYTSETPPELGKIKFGAKKVALLAEKAKFPEAKQTYDYTMDIWKTTKPRLPMDSIDKLNQMDLSLADLNTAIEAKNPMVVKAKSEVILKIIDELEKGGKGKSGQGSGSGSGSGSSK